MPVELLMHYVKQGPVPIHNSMDALAAASLSYNYDEGPKLVSSCLLNGFCYGPLVTYLCCSFEYSDSYPTCNLGMST